MLPSFITTGSEESTQARTINRPFSETSIFPVLTADKLLASAQRQKILGEIKALTQAPDEYYAALYKKLIDNLVEFVQVIPTTNESRLCSLLDEALLRGLFVLEMQKNEDFEPLMMYALFSASLLFDVGQVLAERTVIISDQEGGYVREWFIYAGAMKEEDGYYKIRRGAGINPWLARRITPLLARQLMPEMAFNWLATDPHIFSMWLALLLDDKEASGSLSLFFNRALAHLAEFKNTQGYIMEMDVEILEPPETKLGEEFIKWLKEYLKHGGDVNRPGANIQVVNKGVVVKLGPLVKKFAAAKGKKVTAAAVGNQLKKLGMVKGAVKLVAAGAKKAPGTLFKAAAKGGGGGYKLSNVEMGVLLQAIGSQMLTASSRIAANAAIKAVSVTNPESEASKTYGDPKAYGKALKAIPATEFIPAKMNFKVEIKG